MVLLPRFDKMQACEDSLFILDRLDCLSVLHFILLLSFILEVKFLFSQSDITPSLTIKNIC